MTLFCKLDDLVSESDVEQKLVWPILTSQPPLGLRYSTTDVATKTDIGALTIGRGQRPSSTSQTMPLLLLVFPYLSSKRNVLARMSRKGLAKQGFTRRN